MPITIQKHVLSSQAAPTAVVELLQQGDPVCFTAAGNSMHPLIPSGSAVTVRPFRATDAKPGAILLFRHGRRLVLHRLVRIDPGDRTARFCGDMNHQGHETVALTAILGTAVSAVRPDGTDRVLQLQTRPVRWAGLLRHHARPLRRGLSRLAGWCRRRS